MANNRQGRPQKISKRVLDRRLVFGAFVVILLVFGGLIMRKYLSLKPVTAPPPATSEAPRKLREVILYFAAPDGTHLVAEGREIDDCLVEVDCVRETVQALLDGPLDDLAPILPPQAVVHDLEVVDSTVVIDFGSGLVSGHPGGTQSELLTVYGLVDTLAANFPHLRQVEILVDGHPVETLKGHVDLRQPVSADFSLVEEGSAPTGDIRSLAPRETE